MNSRIGNIENKDGNWDRVGLWLSGVCVVHCLLTPIIVAVLPMGSSFLDLDTWTHWVLGLLLIPTVFIGVRSSIKNGRPARIRGYFFLGGLLVFLGLLAGEYSGEFAESILTIIGGILLVIGHWQNWKGGQ